MGLHLLWSCRSPQARRGKLARQRLLDRCIMAVALGLWAGILVAEFDL